MGKRKRVDTTNLDAVEVYKSVLCGSRSRFPSNFWKRGKESKKDAAKITRFLIEEYLQWNKETVKKEICFYTFTDNLLGGMVGFFHGSTYKTLENAYPHRYKVWELQKVPVSSGYWNKTRNVKAATKWLFEKKLKWSDDDIKKKLTLDIFFQYGLGGMVHIRFGDSRMAVLELVYPGRFKPWELQVDPIKFWTREKGQEAMKWLIEEKLKWDEKSIKENLSRDVILENNLRGMLERAFGNCLYTAVESVYPEIKPWELKNKACFKWSDELTREAVKWLVEEKLGLSQHEIREYTFSFETFKQYGLGWMLRTKFKKDAHLALKNAYPELFEQVA